MVQAAEAAPSRDQIKEQLLSKAQNYFDTFEQYKVVFEDTERNYVARQAIDDNNMAVTIVKFRCDGFT